MEARARRLEAEGHKTELFELMHKRGRTRLTSGVWARALKRGDHLATMIIDDAVDALGNGIASAVNLLDIEAVVIGGGLGDRLGQPYVERIKAAMAPHLFADDRPPAVLPSGLGDLGGALGAARLDRRLTAAGPEADHVRIRAANPGPYTLEGTNTWVVGRDPAYVIDPGPALPAHVAAVVAELDARGGLGAVLLTHDHHDHSEAVGLLRERRPAPLAAARGPVDVLLVDGDRLGPLLALATPGHAPDHLAFLAGPACFTGDAVLGAGSVFVAPLPGAMSAYLAALRRLRALAPAVICPGHGPTITDPRPSSTSTWPTGRRARRAWSPRSPPACGRSTSSSTACGARCPRRCAWPRQSPSRPTSTSSPASGGCRPGSSGVATTGPRLPDRRRAAARRL